MTKRWVVVAARKEPKSADDLHVMQAYQYENQWFRMNHARLHLAVLTEPARYRSTARKAKKELITKLGLSRSDYALNSIPDHEAY